MQEAVAKRTFTPGLVVSFTNIGDGQSREDLKDAFELYGTVAYVDFSRGNTEGFIRYGAPESAAGIRSVPSALSAASTLSEGATASPAALTANGVASSRSGLMPESCVLSVMVCSFQALPVLRPNLSEWFAQAGSIQ